MNNPAYSTVGAAIMPDVLELTLNRFTAIFFFAAANIAQSYAGGRVAVMDIDTNQNLYTVTGGIDVENGPEGCALTPDGSALFVTNGASGTVSVVDTLADSVVPPSIPVGANPQGVAIGQTPNGVYAYVANQQSDSVTIIDTGSITVVGLVENLGGYPYGVAITPDGGRVFVTVSYSPKGAGILRILETTNNTLLPDIISVGQSPLGVSITPDGQLAYVANNLSDTVSVINADPSSPNYEQRVVPDISVGRGPEWIAFRWGPDADADRRAYVTCERAWSLAAIRISDQSVENVNIPVGTGPEKIAITPDGKAALVPNEWDISVSIIGTDPGDPQSYQQPLVPDVKDWFLKCSPEAVAIFHPADYPDGVFKAFITNEAPAPPGLDCEN